MHTAVYTAAGLVKRNCDHCCASPDPQTCSSTVPCRPCRARIHGTASCGVRSTRSTLQGWSRSLYTDLPMQYQDSPIRRIAAEQRHLRCVLPLRFVRDTATFVCTIICHVSVSSIATPRRKGSVCLSREVQAKQYSVGWCTRFYLRNIHSRFQALLYGDTRSSHRNHAVDHSMVAQIAL